MKGIISRLHFTTLINILPKLSTLWGEFIYKSVKRFIQYFCFPDWPIKGGHLGFLEKGNLRKGGGGLT